jgi:ABC-type nitrate/sulfonate/bicarbonate transport system substrate-binding protein
MALRRGGLLLFVVLCLLAAGWFAASRLGYLDRLVARLFPKAVVVRLSPGDFPAGVAAPVGDVASVPVRPTRIGFVPRGTAASLLLAAGGARTPEEVDEPGTSGLFSAAYALSARALVYAREIELKRALAEGGDHGGVDMALLGVDRLAEWAPALRDAAPRAVMLVGRSRGQDALAAVGLETLAELRGKRLAAHAQSSAYYFSLWLLSRAGLRMQDVRWVELPSTLDAGRALREGRADAVVGFRADVDLAARDRGGKLLASTVDAPHLLATVLVVRGEFAARYPDAVRRVLRGLLDAGLAVKKDPLPAARLLGEVAPYLGDPLEAIASAPPADLKENLSFFGLAGEAPVTYDELLDSAGALFVKTGRITRTTAAEDTRDLGALKYVSQARGP